MGGKIGGAAKVTFRSNTEVAIQVPDMAKAAAFYRDVLGFRVVSETAEHLEIDTGVLRLYVMPGDTLRSFIPSLDVPSFELAKKHLIAAGCASVPTGSGGVYFEDPFGFVFDIVERE